jgi:putative peptidoglycan lipid II flippase
MAGWIEFHLLRRGLLSRLGSTRLPAAFMARLWGSALAAAAAAWVVKLALEGQHPLVVALFSLGMYGAAYFAIAAALGVPHAWRILGRVGWRRGS